MCERRTCIMWSSLVISTASWQWSSAVKTELQALGRNEDTPLRTQDLLRMYDCEVSAFVVFFFHFPAVPEFELAAHLSMFDLDELIVAGCHATVLHKPLEAGARLSGVWRRKKNKWENWTRIHSVASCSPTTFHCHQTNNRKKTLKAGIMLLLRDS